ncbi:A nuclease family of the HNH/ENDO VII superfamily with conserved AHH [Stigmatella aurantiaca]|uniref:A nuclease family of the HNH/ENDO VII superfamily with conserved AHH n=1 Tax=Stigmatella aurantiaca TaxID=41 RepID=A0A1H7M3V5_STIAU|nr:AHH domain-containing protein [Stigmatella aurantiaca]SEL05792.1 A nuclease family of the HNH/ENDO VII superfamily with conserved AHH [Stigmatella aurantiaca]
MRPWQVLWKTEALVLALLLGCSSVPRGARVEAGTRGETLVYIPRTATVERVELTSGETSQALRRLARQVRLTGSPREMVERLFQLDALSGDYLYLSRERKLVPMEEKTLLEGTLTEAEQRLVNRYRKWCRDTQGIGSDCLGGALVAGKYLDLQGRYMLAMALSRSPVLEEFEKALGEMVSMRAVLQAALTATVTLLVLLAMPEPVTKLVAAWAAAALIVWVGAQTLYTLVTGWFQLMEAVKVATTFEEIRGAGEAFGKLFSREAAQAFALVAMALLTHTSKSFAEQVGTLPGSAQASMQAAAGEGILLSEVSAVTSVTVTAEGFLAVLPPSAVAMAVRGGQRGRTEKHHLGTIANTKSTLRGGPWTPRFEELFARAGMRLKDPENIVPVEGHKGPHPQRYHQIIYRRLQVTLGDCRTIVECRAGLIRELRALSAEITTPGTELNQLVTLGK